MNVNEEFLFPDLDVIISWNMSLTDRHAPITSYEIYCYEDSGNARPHQPVQSNTLWRLLARLMPVPLPMFCTIKTIVRHSHFVVRALDKFGRSGSFSKRS